MNPWMVKHALYPLHERVFRRATFPYLRRLEESQWFTPSELARLQGHKLRALLVHAHQHCPFYRQRLAQAGIVPEHARVADLQHLPLLTKADLRKYRPLLTCPDVPGGLQRFTTGGSTGEPLVFYFDRRRQAYDQAARMRTHRWFGADVGQPEVYLWGSPIELARQNRLRRIRDRLTNNLLLNAFDMSAARMDQYLERIERFNPVSLFGYPSSLALLASRGQATARELHLPRLRAVFVTGETLTPHHRAQLQDYFHVPVADGYGSREGGFIAHQCPHGRLHLTDENILLEILDPDHQPVAPGQMGRLVITHLDTFAMPFIRYLTGDLARRDDSAQPCPCGRGLTLIHSVEGRKTDFLVAADGTIRHALSAIYVLREREEIEQYRIVQDADFSVRVDLLCRDGLGHHLRDSIHQGLVRALGPDLDLHLNEVTDLPPLDSGKHRPVISHVQLDEVLT